MEVVDAELPAATTAVDDDVVRYRAVVPWRSLHPVILVYNYPTAIVKKSVVGNYVRAGIRG